MSRRLAVRAISPSSSGLFTLVLVVALCYLHLPSARAQQSSAPCGLTSSIPQGNRLSHETFRMFVRRPDLVGSPDAQIPSGFTAASQFGATGNGKQDDTEALQNALDKARRVWLKPNGTYRISRRLTLRDQRQLASDGTATLLLARGVSGFSNTSIDRNELGLYSQSGTGLLLEGTGITLRDVYIVKEYEDDRYVIGVEVRSAAGVLINRVRLRGFSLAPGIITVRRGSRNVTVSNSLIHASCSMSIKAPPPPVVSSFQITGIVVDDSPLIPPASERITISNNVIVDLYMKPITSRGDQTDGINFGGIRTGNNSRIENNFINHVAEGIDLFGANIIVANNDIGGREQAIKLIHGARDIQILQNHITGKPSISGVGIWTSGEEGRRVEDIRISHNVFDMRYTTKPGIFVDRTGAYPPSKVIIEENRFLVNSCAFEAVSCDALHQCSERDNDKLHEGVFPCPP